MKKIIFITFVSLLLVISLTSCEKHEAENQISEESTPKETENEDKVAEEEIPEGYRIEDFGEFTVLVCDSSFAGCAPNETVTMVNNQFKGDERVIAEFLEVSNAADSENPFALCDEKYSSAIDTSELSFDGFSAKKYHVKTQMEGPVPALINTIHYCIDLDGKIVTFAYYPVMGLGGLHTEDIETVLDTIRIK